MQRATSALALSCLLAACGGEGESTSDTAQDAAAQNDHARAALARQAPAAASKEQFGRDLREPGDTLAWTQSDVTVGNTTAVTQYADHVTTVNADGSYGFDRIDADGNATERYTSNVDGDRTSRRVLANGNLCSFSPGRNYLSFPLSVGKTWLSNWTQNCTLGYRETANQLAAVTGRETVTVPAGRFDALRIGYVTLFTKSNDVNLANGSKGEAAYLQEATCWWAIEPKRIVKCTYRNTFFGSAPARYLKRYDLEARFVGKQYLPGPRHAGQSSLWTETDAYVNGNTATRSYTQAVSAVNADGSYVVDRIEANGALGERYLHDIGGNRLTRHIASSGNDCTYSPRRAYLDFPLHVGKTWDAPWHYGCALGYREDAAHTATVEALDTVTLAQGAVEALRIRFHTQFSHSNDAALLNGSAGEARYGNDGVCWWATATQRLVKCEIDVGFEGAAPATYRRRYTTELVSTLVP
jgi:hypothetical protein